MAFTSATSGARGRRRRAIETFRGDFSRDPSISGDTKNFLTRALAGEEVVDPLTGKKRRFSFKEAQSLFKTARRGDAPVFRQRQRNEKARTLLSERPGQRGLLGGAGVSAQAKPQEKLFTNNKQPKLGV